MEIPPMVMRGFVAMYRGLCTVGYVLWAMYCEAPVEIQIT